MTRFHVILLRPRIPTNTGSIGRTCLGYNASLHLVKPYGFELSEKQLKRAGLDYWKNVDLKEYDSLDCFLEKVDDLFDHLVIFSKSEQVGETCLTKYQFPTDCENVGLLFGNETQGVTFCPSSFIEKYDKVYLPMAPEIRSFNLSCSVAMGLYDAHRQLKPGVFE